ncbi:unnamed protein product [Effrenium voratum]|nr:unnamed protein product [Effrenium voratum]
MATTHVDDIALSADESWLNNLYVLFVKRFKKVTRNRLPFEHCGCEYGATVDGFSITQREFCKKIPLAPVPARAPESKLLPKEITDLKSALGALQWLTATRLDIISDVSALQSVAKTGEVKHVQQVNKVIKQAQSVNNQNLGLHHRRFHSKHQRIVAIHDASSATKGRDDAMQEGILVLLMDDIWHGREIPPHQICKEEETVRHGGVGHVLYAHGCKAKRISYSTSHSETLSAASAMEIATLVRLRMSEVDYPKVMPSIKQLIGIQEAGDMNMPLDMYTDCKDYFSLVTGTSLPQDRTQRLYVLAVRESRIAGRIRLTCLVPTEYMTADALTKPMVSPVMMKMLSTGLVEFHNADHNMEVKYLPAIKEYTEEDIIAGDQSIIDKIAFGGLVLLQGGKLALCFAAMATMPMVSAGKIGEDVHVTVSADEDDFYTNYFIYGIIAISMAAALLVERTIFQLMRWHSDHRDAVNQSKLSSLQGELANAIKKIKEEKNAREEAEHACTLLRRTLERVQGERTRGQEHLRGQKRLNTSR